MVRRVLRLITLAALLLIVGCTQRVSPTPRVVAGNAHSDTSPIITTVAGNGQQGHSGDWGLATGASLFSPGGIAVGRDESLFILELSSIRKVNPKGIITTVAGRPPKVTLQSWSHPGVVMTAPSGPPGVTGDGGSASKATLYLPRGIAVGPDGSLFIADTGHHRVRKVDAKGIITTVAGDGWTTKSEKYPGEKYLPSGRFTGDGGPATKASLNMPTGVAVGADGTLYIADTHNNRVRKVDRKGMIATIAGNGQYRYSGDGGPAIKAGVAGPRYVTVAADGSLLIVDTNHHVRKVDPKGMITTVAGDGWTDKIGNGRFSGDGGPATKASLNMPADVAVGPDGDIFIADVLNHRIRRVDNKGVITTVAGDGCTDERGQGRFAGDGGPATEASLDYPTSVAVGRDGSLYIVDSGNLRVRKVTWK